MLESMTLYKIKYVYGSGLPDSDRIHGPLFRPWICCKSEPENKGPHKGSNPGNKSWKLAQKT